MLYSVNENQLLGRFDAFRKNYSKLVYSYVLDALETAGSMVNKEREPPRARASRILQSAAGASVEKRKSVTLGNDIRLESDFLLPTSSVPSLLPKYLTVKDIGKWPFKNDFRQNLSWEKVGSVYELHLAPWPLRSSTSEV